MARLTKFAHCTNWYSKRSRSDRAYFAKVTGALFPAPAHFALHAIYKGTNYKYFYYCIS